ncbi:Hsp20/alpha crystallin family protein [Chitinimonas lacunae]|uniref:Hsp20/alpha crystallin family protein n=1 Tax=Chitinimonas lacunae TaxID=1963018 RepID=A0ABV8MQH1_9NEIS
MDNTSVANRQNQTQEQARSEASLIPPVQVIEDSRGITLYADLPGVPRDKLSLQIEANTLTIEGQLGLEIPEGLQSSHVEVSLPRYQRVFTLSKELDADKVQAEFHHGVLTLRIPKTEQVQPRKIEVKVAGAAR